MIERQITYFDLGQIARSGQCFRMYETAPGRFSLTAMDRYLEVRQEDDRFWFDCGEEEFDGFWAHYFDLETDYGGFIARIGKRDRYLQAAAAAGSGIRILNQDLWEVMVTFLISQNNHIKRIRQCVERLCLHFGEKKETPEGHVYYAMPGPAALADPDRLKDMGLGYRDRYIARLAADVAEGRISLEHLKRIRSRKQTHQELTAIYGVGDKVADCIQLFGLHQIDTFPVDTWIKKILERHYPKGFPMYRYRGCAGVMQQYMFYYAISEKEAGERRQEP